MLEGSVIERGSVTMTDRPGRQVASSKWLNPALIPMAVSIDAIARGVAPARRHTRQATSVAKG